jgi:hypothetical protein
LKVWPIASSAFRVAGSSESGLMVTTSGSHWWWTRPAATAIGRFIRASRTLVTTWMTPVGMNAPPEAPMASSTRPGRSFWKTSVGAIDETGILLGAMPLPSP